MATYVKFQCFVEDLTKEIHNLASDTITVALTNTAPSASTDTVLTDIAQVSYTNCSARDITVTSCVQTTGTLAFVLADLTLTASGAVGPFQYVVIYNNSAANDNLICYYNYGSAVTMANTDTFKLDFGANLFTLA
jgi:hypothetical protein